MTSGDLAIEISDLKVYFKRDPSAVDWIRRRPRQIVRAVDGVDLRVLAGEALGLVGESGSGKSTLARAIVGLQASDSGEIRIQGAVLPARRTQVDRRRVQMVFQDPYSSLNPRMTVGQVLRELLSVHGIVPRKDLNKRAVELLSLVGLSRSALDRRPREFSGGQRQRIGIARALALNPDILVADEAVSALDVSMQASILNLLRNLQKELGLTLLFVAHDLAVVRHLCDRVAVMYLGRIIEVAPTAEIFDGPQHPYTQGLLRAIPRLAPGSRKRGAAIAGDPPSPLRVPAGCRFHTRCPIAADICSSADPELLATSAEGSGHLSACHFSRPQPVAASSATGSGAARPTGSVE
jgi:oligopeptide/dipeptide ABC transporter ATP-binding protein